MCLLKGQAKFATSKSIVYLETTLLQLLLIGQQRIIVLGPLFAYELCAIPPPLIDRQGCLRKSNKSGNVKRLVVDDISLKSADTIIIDVS